MKKLKPVPECVIALDPGNNFGWAVFYRGRRMRSGTWFLLGPSQGQKPRTKRWNVLKTSLTQLIRDCHRRYNVLPVIAHEMVTFVSGGIAATHVFGGWLCCIDQVNESYKNKIPIEKVKVSTWKSEILGERMGHAKLDIYVPIINKLLKLTLTKKEEDEAAACGVGLQAIRQLRGQYEAGIKRPKSKRRS